MSRRQKAPSKPRKPRRASIADLIRQGRKVGASISSITLPDGTVVRFGEKSTPGPDNSWDEVYAQDQKRAS